MLEGLARAAARVHARRRRAADRGGGGSTLLGAVLTVGRETKPKAGASWTTALAIDPHRQAHRRPERPRRLRPRAQRRRARQRLLTVGAGGGGAVSAAATVLAERSHVVKLPFGVKVPIKLAPEGVQATMESSGGEKKVW